MRAFTVDKITTNKREVRARLWDDVRDLKLPGRRFAILAGEHPKEEIGCIRVRFIEPEIVAFDKSAANVATANALGAGVTGVKGNVCRTLIGREFDFINLDLCRHLSSEGRAIQTAARSAKHALAVFVSFSSGGANGEAARAREALVKESTTLVARAVRKETTDAEKRAIQVETPGVEERAATAESTKPGEQAKNIESPKIEKRATPRETTKQIERAVQDETPTSEERAASVEKSKVEECAVAVETPKAGERATDAESPNDLERVNACETTNEVERAEVVETPSTSERANDAEPSKVRERLSDAQHGRALLLTDIVRAARPDAQVVRVYAYTGKMHMLGVLFRFTKRPIVELPAYCPANEEPTTRRRLTLMCLGVAGDQLDHRLRSSERNRKRIVKEIKCAS